MLVLSGWLVFTFPGVKPHRNIGFRLIAQRLMKGGQSSDLW
jgi:hypothetical protein